MTEIPFIADGRSVVPPMLDPSLGDQKDFVDGLLEGLGERALRSSVLSPLFEGMFDEIRRVLEQQGILTDQARQDWSKMSKDNSEVMGEIRDALNAQSAASVQSVGAAARQGHVAKIEGMALPETVQDAAINFLDSLGLYGQQVQQQAFAQREAGRISGLSDATTEQIEKILATLGIDPNLVERAQRAQESLAAPAAGPYEDVIETGTVQPGDKPSAEGVPEGRATDASREADREARKAARAGDSATQQEQQERQRPRGTGAVAAPTHATPVGPQLPEPEDPMDTWSEGVRRYGDSGTWREMAVDRARSGIDRIASERLGDRPDRHVVNGPRGPEWAWVDPEEGERWEGRANRFGQVYEALDEYAGGAGVSGAIAKVAPQLGKALGVAGAAYGAASLATGFMEDQRQANAAYTQVYGEGQMDAYGQRAREWLFSNVQTMGLMGSDDASRLYQGIASTGMRGQDRAAALDFGVSTYRDFGMDVATSMRFIEMAGSQGIEALSDYEAGLHTLAEVAKESGESIKEAHEAYAQAIAQAQQISSGSDAAEIAAATTAISTSLAHTPLENVDWSRMVGDEQIVHRAALSAGLDYEEFNASVRAGDTAALSTLYNTSLADAINATVQRPPSQKTQQRIDDIMRASGGRPSNEQVLEVARLLSEEGVYSSRDVVRRIRDFTGLNVTPEEARQMVTRAIMGDTRMDVGAVIQDTSEKFEEASLDVDRLRPEGAERYLTGAVWQGRKGAMDEWGLTKNRLGGFRFWDNAITGEGSGEIYDSANAYFDTVLEGRDRSANMESIYKHIASQEGEDAAAWGKRRFQVLQPDGSTKEVGLEDLPSYIEQVESGQVQMIGPDGRSVALQDVVGYTPEGGPERQQNVRVEVEAKGPLADLLKINTLGGEEAETSRSRGTPMSATGTTTRWRP